MVGGASRPVWVDRNTELGLLESSLEQVRAGHPRAVLVLGETGVGKSALVAEFARRAQVRSFVGRCFKFAGGTVPYLPLVEILRAFSSEAEPAEVVRVLGPARADLARLLPELAPRAETDAGRATVRPDAEDAHLERARLFERLLGVVERLGHDEPTIVIIEDAHRIDESTLDILVFMLQSVRHAKLMLIVTCRSDDLLPGDPFLMVTAELEQAGVLERIELPRFARPEVEEQVAQLVGRALDPRLVERIVARSGGNPMFVEELVKAGGGEEDQRIPGGLRDILLGRVAALSTASRELVRFAAIAGQSVDEPVLAATGFSGPVLAAALREAADEQLLVPSRNSGQATYEFRYPLLREVIYDDLLPVERERGHAAIAKVLSAEQATGPGATAELAYHWYAAREFGRALPAAIQAGIAAYLAYAFAEADRHFQHALELWPKVPFADDRVGIDQVSLLEYATESAMRIGDYERAITLGKAVIAAVDPQADAERASAAHTRMRWVLWESGDYAAALADAEEAARLIPVEPPSSMRANVLGHLAALRMFSGDLHRALELATESARVAQAARPPAPAEEALASGTIGLCQVRLGQVEQGLANVRKALAIAEQLEHVTGIAVGYSQFAGILTELGRAEDALEVAQQGIAAAKRLGLERTFGALLRGSASHALYELGRWDDVAATGETSPGSILVDIGRGRLKDARLALAEPGNSSRTAADELARQLKALVNAELALADTDPAAVGASYQRAPVITEQARQPAVERELIVLAIRAWTDLAESARAHNDPTALKQAEAAARSLVRQLQSADGPVAVAQQATAAAEYGRALGRSKPEEWLAAVEGWRSAHRPYREAYCCLRQAEAVVRTGGTRSDAEPILRLAHELASSLGAEPLRTKIVQLARRLRVSLDDVASGQPVAGSNELTQREREVLALMAAGRTNREIGETLFISPKTASVHVSNIFAKLGVERRVEAVQAAQQLGLLGESAAGGASGAASSANVPTGLSPRRLQALAYIDIVGSTELLSDIGDTAWRLLLERFYGMLEAQLRRSGGREVDRAGDGLLAAFEEPTNAVRWALAVRTAAGELRLRVRTGIHAGEVELAGKSVRGIAVHVAARIAAAAQPDEVLVSSTVRDLVAGTGLSFEDRGLHALKGVAEPRRLYAAR